MAPTASTKDYYAILDICQTADVVSVKSSYKSLAKIKHPDKNLTNPNATAEFQLLQEAYSVLCDPITRREYDIKYAFIRHTHQANPPKSNAKTYQPQTSSRTKPTEDNQAEKKHRAAQREKRLQELNDRKAHLAKQSSEESTVLNKLQDELRKLQEDADKESKVQAAREGWWAYLTSFDTANPQETEEEKGERDRRQSDRRAAQSIKEKLLERQTAALRNLGASLRIVDEAIEKIRDDRRREELEDELARRREAQKRNAEAEEKRRRAEAEEEKRRRAEAEEEKRRRAEAEEEKRREEAAAKRRAQGDAQWRAGQEQFHQQFEATMPEERTRQQAEETRRKQAQETRRKQAQETRRKQAEEKRRKQAQETRRKQAEEKRRKQAEEKRRKRAEEKRRKQAEERRRKQAEESKMSEGEASARMRNSNTRSSTTTALCHHKGWWQQVDGAQMCSNCSTVTRRYAFKCPGCSKVACASCRIVLKGSEPRRRTSST